MHVLVQWPCCSLLVSEKYSFSLTPRSLPQYPHTNLGNDCLFFFPLKQEPNPVKFPEVLMTKCGGRMRKNHFANKFWKSHSHSDGGISEDGESDLSLADTHRGQGNISPHLHHLHRSWLESMSKTHNSVSHLSLPGMENVPEIQYVTEQKKGFLSISALVHTPSTQKTPIHISKPSRHASSHRLPFVTITESCSIYFLCFPHSSSEVLSLSVAQSVFAWPSL